MIPTPPLFSITSPSPSIRCLVHLCLNREYDSQGFIPLHLPLPVNLRSGRPSCIPNLRVHELPLGPTFRSIHNPDPSVPRISKLSGTVSTRRTFSRAIHKETSFPSTFHHNWTSLFVPVYSFSHHHKIDTGRRMSDSPFKAPLPVPPRSTQGPRPKKRRNGLHNITDTRAIANFCLAMEIVLQSESDSDMSSSSGESSQFSSSPHLSGATPWTADGRTGVTISIPRLAVSSGSRPSSHISDTTSSQASASPCSHLDSFISSAGDTPVPTTSTPTPKSPLSQDEILNFFETDSQDDVFKKLPASMDIPDELLIQAAEDYEASTFLLAHNFDSEQSLFDDAFFETDPSWAEPRATSTPTLPSDNISEQSQIIRDDDPGQQDLEDSMSLPPSEGDRIMNTAMATIQGNTTIASEPMQEDSPPHPDLTPDPPVDASISNTSLNTSKKRTHADDDSDAPDDLNNSRPTEKSPRLSPGSTSTSSNRTSKPKETPHTNTNPRPAPQPDGPTPPDASKHSRSGNDSHKEHSAPNSKGKQKHSSRAQSPSISPIRGEKPKAAGPTAGDNKERSERSQQHSEHRQGKKQRERARPASPPPREKTRPISPPPRQPTPMLQEFDPTNEQFEVTPGCFQIDINNHVARARSHNKVAPSLGGDIDDSDPKVTIYTENTRFSAEDLLPRQQEQLDPDETIEFPELHCQKGARKITLRKDGPVYFLLVTRKPIEKKWTVTPLEMFIDYMNLIQSSLLEEDPDFGEALAWFNPWSSHNMGLIGINPDIPEAFHALRQFITSRSYNGQVFNTYPKELIAKRYDFTALLKKNLRTFNMRVLTKAIFKKNPSLNLKGDLVLHKHIDFDSKERSKQGESKADWRLALLTGSETFMNSIRHLPNSHPFNIGSAPIQLRGGDRRKEFKKSDHSRSSQQQQQHGNQSGPTPTPPPTHSRRPDIFEPEWKRQQQQRSNQPTPAERRHREANAPQRTRETPHSDRSGSRSRTDSGRPSDRPASSSSATATSTRSAPSSGTAPSYADKTKDRRSNTKVPDDPSPAGPTSTRTRDGRAAPGQPSPRDRSESLSKSSHQNPRPAKSPPTNTNTEGVKPRKSYSRSAFLSSSDDSDMETEQIPPRKRDSARPSPPRPQRTVTLVDRPLSAGQDDDINLSAGTIKKLSQLNKSTKSKNKKSPYDRFYQK